MGFEGETKENGLEDLLTDLAPLYMSFDVLQTVVGEQTSACQVSPCTALTVVTNTISCQTFGIIVPLPASRALTL